MRRFINRTLLLGGLLGLLVGCGEVLGEVGISGTVSAPAGRDVVGTRIYACYNNERDCAMLGNVEITQTGESAPYQLSSLPSGSYSVYALRELNGETYYNYYVLPNDRVKRPALVTPPATGIDIQMIVIPNAERSSLPKKLQELSNETLN